MSVTMSEQSRIATIRAYAPVTLPEGQRIADELIRTGAGIDEARKRFLSELRRHRIATASAADFVAALGGDATGLSQRDPTAKPMTRAESDLLLSVLGQ